MTDDSRPASLSRMTGEFSDPVVEDDFLESAWPETRRHYRLTALVIALGNLVVGIGDYVHWGPGLTFGQLMAFRSLPLLVALVPVFLSFRDAYQPSCRGAMILLLWAVFVSMNGVAEINQSVGVNYISGLMIMVSSQYLLIHGSFRHVILSAAGLTLGGLGMAILHFGIDANDADNMAIILLSTNILAVYLLRAANRIQRREYSALRTEQHLTAQLRAEIDRRALVERELRDSRARLHSSSEMLQILRDASPEGVLAVDGIGQVQSWNSRFLELWRSAGVSLPDDLTTLSAAQLRLRLAGALEGGPVVLLPADDPPPGSDLMLRDGRVLEQTTRTFHQPAGTPGRIWFFRDVSDRRRMADELKRAKDAAEELSRSKSEFLAVISHEIRTPLTGILGMNRLLLGSDLDPLQRSWVDAALKSSEVLLAVLNDVLEFARLDSAALEAVDEPCSLPETIQSVVRLLSFKAVEKNLTLTVELSPTLPESVRGDANRLRQILFNLVGNALKFTARGSVRVEAGWQAGWEEQPAAQGQMQGRNQGCLVLEVIDTGIGMSPATLDHIFEPFRQADGLISRDFGGTGLGLAICKRIIDRLGGSITVESRLGDGSRFQVRLPMRQMDATTPSAPSTPPAVTRPLNLLAAEDNEINQRLLLTILESRGHTVTLVPDGVQAVAMARLGGFDVILMDMRMPRLDGLEATRLIRSVPGPAGQVPVLALTASAFASDLAACRAAGVDGLLVKPYTAEALLSELRRLTPEQPSATATADG
jgi:signal transduction histidine kinase/ActR/RegA family two-component response regulator